MGEMRCMSIEAALSKCVYCCEMVVNECFTNFVFCKICNGKTGQKKIQTKRLHRTCFPFCDTCHLLTEKTGISYNILFTVDLKWEFSKQTGQRGISESLLLPHLSGLTVTQCILGLSWSWQLFISSWSRLPVEAAEICPLQLEEGRELEECEAEWFALSGQEE